MFKELFTESKITVYGGSPAGNFTAELNSDGNVTGGKNPWNDRITNDWFWGLADKNSQNQFKTAIMNKDAREASRYTEVSILKIK